MTIKEWLEPYVQSPGFSDPNLSIGLAHSGYSIDCFMNEQMIKKGVIFTLYLRPEPQESLLNFSVN